MAATDEASSLGQLLGANHPHRCIGSDLGPLVDDGAAVVVFELDDCAFPLLAGVDVTSAWDAGFDGASWILALGAPRRTAGMERKDLLAATATSFAEQGRAIEQAAADDVQIIVVGNPANTNCRVDRTVVLSIPAERWHASAASPPPMSSTPRG